MRAIGGAAATTILIIVVACLLLREDPLHRYIRLGCILTDLSTASVFDQYIRSELPPEIQKQLSFGKPRHAAAAVYVIKSIPDKAFALGPFNAAYDSSRDAIFVDKHLIDLARPASANSPGRTLLAFVLLHELGHRTLDRKSGNRYDFLDSKALPESADTTTNKHNHMREIRADLWAAQRFAEFKTQKIGNVRVEPNTLPLMNLPEGLMTELTQYGPYTPFLGDSDHPILFDRLQRFYQSMSEVGDLRRDIALEYSVLASEFRLFLNNVSRHGGGIISLPNGQIPVAMAIEGARVWITSDHSRLFVADVTSLQSGHAAELTATDTGITTPSEVFEDVFTRQHGALYIAAKSSKAVYCLQDGSHAWIKITSPVWTDAHVVNNQLLLSATDDKARTFSLYQLASDGRHFDTSLIGELNRLADTSESVRLIPGVHSLGAAVYDGNGNIRIISTESLRSFGTFPENGFLPISLLGRYVGCVHDRSKPDPNLSGFQFDWTSHAVRIGTDADGRQVAAQFANAGSRTDVIDLLEEKVVLQDLMVSTNPAADSAGGEVDVIRLPGCALLGLRNGNVAFVDNYLCTSQAFALLPGSRSILAVAIPYSRFVLLWRL